MAEPPIIDPTPPDPADVRIPDALVARARAGRVTVVVGCGVRGASWRALVDQLARAAAAGAADSAVLAEVARRADRGELARAIGVLARVLGEATCVALARAHWGATGEPEPLLEALGRLPVPHVWTTLPDDALARAIAAGSPPGWPPPRAVAPADAGALPRHHRAVVRLLGAGASYALTPAAVRRALADAPELRAAAARRYGDETLVLVGFLLGDPDLEVILERLCGACAPPAGPHYLVGPVIEPAQREELRVEHSVEVVPIAPAAADPAARAAGLAAWLAALAARCAAAGIALDEERPHADDLDGWLARIADAPATAAEARAAVAQIELRARAAGRWDVVTAALIGRIEHVGSPDQRAALLSELAEVYAQHRGDPGRALEAATAACHLAPADPELAARAERHAAAAGAWAELVAEAQEVAARAVPATVAAAWWARAGAWTAAHLDRPDLADAALRRAIELDPRHPGRYVERAALLRAQARWAELAAVLRAHAAIEPDPAARGDLLASVGELCEGPLADPAAAAAAYEAAAALEPPAERALDAIESAARRAGRWESVADLLERRAAACVARGESARAAELRSELACIRAEKLGDLDSAIARAEAAAAEPTADPAGALDALRELAGLYDRARRPEEAIGALERLAAAAPAAERPGALRRLAAVLAERDPARAIGAYQRWLALDGAAADAHRGLARALEALGRWAELAAALARHAAAAAAPGERTELLIAAARVLEDRAGVIPGAIDALEQALAIEPEHGGALAALAALYHRVGDVERAIQLHLRRAALEPAGAPAYAEAGRLAAEELGDGERAERCYELALASGGDRRAALRGLAAVHERRGSWARAVELLLLAEAAAPSRDERAALAWRAALIAEEHLGDATRSLELAERVLRLDPDHVGAGQRVADRLAALDRWADAIPVLERLARHAAGAPPSVRAHRDAQLGRAYAAARRLDLAAQSYRRAHDADPGAVEAALGLAAVAPALAPAAAADAAEPTDARAPWPEVDRRLRAALVHHRGALAPARAAAVWHHLAVAAGALGDDAQVEPNLRRALELDPGHAGARAALAERGQARGAWDLVLEARRLELAALDAAPAADPGLSARRAGLLEEIGDLHGARLADPGAAAAAYAAALRVAPSARGLLHKLLEARTAERNWPAAIDALDALAGREEVAARRARFHYAAAVIASEELGDHELAADRFGAALDASPLTPGALDGLAGVYARREDWRALGRAYRRQLKRLGDDAAPELLADLWTQLGDVYAERLGDREAAIEAYRIASELAPAELARRERLVDLYLEAGAPRRREAIAELHALLARAPDRLELYQALAALYRAEHETDAAWCMAQALVVLGAASPEERHLYERLRPAALALAPPPHRLAGSLWRRVAAPWPGHRDVDPALRGIGGLLAAALARPLAAFGLAPDAQADLERDPRLPIQAARYATAVLALEPLPMVWLDPAREGLRLANAVALSVERWRLAPALVIGAPHAARPDARELAFEIGKRLAYLRPELFPLVALGAPSQLAIAVAAAAIASGAEPATAPPTGAERAAPDDVGRLAAALRAQVSAPMLEELRQWSMQVAARVPAGELAPALAAWQSAADLASSRAGLLIASDLEIAARAVATDPTPLTSLSVKERLRDLIAYAVSEPYLEARRLLGSCVHEGDTPPTRGG
jgi:tetratricopeptide (TPR) repeat protein